MIRKEKDILDLMGKSIAHSMPQTMRTSPQVVRKGVITSVQTGTKSATVTIQPSGTVLRSIKYPQYASGVQAGMLCLVASVNQKSIGDNYIIGIYQ